QDMFPTPALETPHQQFVHAQPLAEHHGLAARCFEHFVEQHGRLARLGTLIAAVIDEIAVVARHAHALHGDHQPSLVRLRQKTIAPPFLDDARDNLQILRVVLALKFRHRHENVRVDAFGQLIEYLVLVPPHQNRLQRLADLVEVAITDDLAVRVTHLMIVQQAEGGAETEAIDELHDGDEFLQAVLQRRAGQDERIRSRDLLDAAGRACDPVLDALRLVENDQIRRPRLYEIEIAMYRIVIGDFEERLGGEMNFTASAQATHDFDAAVTEAFNLALPLMFERGRTDDQYALDAE